MARFGRIIIMNCLVLFFFYWYGDRRDLHSFPTRRSSDLLAVRTRRGDAFVVSDLDAPGWLERFTAQDRTLAPAGEQLIQGQIPIAPGESRADGAARAEELLDLAFEGWRSRVTWRRDAVANGRT